MFDLGTLYAENPQEWSVDDVYYWAIGKVGVDEESASALKNQNVDGNSLLNLTKEEISQMVPRFAMKLATTIQNLRNHWAKRIACMRSDTHTYLIMNNNNLLVFVCQH